LQGSDKAWFDVEKVEDVVIPGSFSKKLNELDRIGSLPLYELLILMERQYPLYPTLTTRGEGKIWREPS
jgi:hypothetical protein